MPDITPFRFTMTTDIHRQVQPELIQNLKFCCEKINNEYGGPGDFMVSIGDLTDDWPGAGWCEGCGPSCPEVARNVIDSQFGGTFRWVPVVGNHDIIDNSGCGIQWVRDEWSGNNPSQVGYRETIADYAFPGPTGCSTTQYYFFHKGMMFVVMNWFWDGTTGGTADEDGYNNDTAAAGGKIIQPQLEWLGEIFNTYPTYPKIIFGHGNAFAFSDRHTDYSYLGGATRENRDRFWKLLEDNSAIAYIHGHTHERRIDFVDNSYSSGGSIGDNWSYGPSKVAHICPGQIHPKWPYDILGANSYPTFMDISINEALVTFTIHENIDFFGMLENWSIVKTATVPMPLIDEYGEEARGGVWYYTQNKFGTDWFNKADNKKGWTVDFGLRVSDVQNSELIIDENNKGKGIGLYVNDGTRQETINFLSQEIIFSNANQSIIYDATADTNYRLTGKENNLKLYARSSDESSYFEISDVNFSRKANTNANALNTSIFEDVNGNLHVVWWDDGDNKGSLFYSKFDGTNWSEAEEIVELDNGVQFPSIVVDSSENIYVVFESKQTEGSIIGLIYKNNIGWSDPYYTGQDIGYCKHPKLIFDSQSNVCVVWEDSRKTHPEIYINIFLTNQLSWKGEEQLSSNLYGSYRPSIASYMDDTFVAWARKAEDDTSIIEIIKYNAISSQKSEIVGISGVSGKADHVSILANVSGRIFAVWQDNLDGEYKIYATILAPSLDIIYSVSAIVLGNGGAKYPVLSEQITTGNVYVAWQDYKDDSYTEFDAFGNPSEALDPYYDMPLQDIKPANTAIFMAVYRDGDFESSGNGSFDVMLSFRDGRNSYFPALPVFFSGELPITYEYYLTDEYNFVSPPNMLSKAGCAFYTLSRDSAIFSVNYGGKDDEYGVDRDYTLNKDIFTKEIRFGDFSDVLNAHYIFKEIKYYLNDSVEPYSVSEISINTVNIDSLSAHDAVVNNYGDVWIVGLCGMNYYVNRQGRIISLGENEELPGLVADDGSRQNDEALLKTFKAISFDKYNNMYIGGSSGIRYSLEHVEGFKTLNENLAPITDNTTTMVFDKENQLFVGTSTGLKGYSISYVDGVPSATELTLSDAPTSHITSLKVDDNNCLWIGTRNGLYRFYKNNFLYFITSHGLSSDIINDIAIRNTAIRYVATSNGIDKMVGLNVDNTLSSEDDSIWNNNVKSVMWKDPNILFAGTLSQLNQIIINDDDNTYSTVFYEPSSSLNVTEDDFYVYYITTTGLDISSSDIVEVYINGNLTHYGYDINYNNDMIRFKMPLENDDIVEVVVRSDSEKVATFSQTQDEKESMGGKVIKITDLAVEDLGAEGGNIYVVTEGDENEVKINDSNSILPFDRVHLDTRPPWFPVSADGIKIGEQVDRTVVKISISGATDNFVDSSGNILDSGSGVDRMIISNYSNFTTNGVASQESVPFSTSVNHDLGSSLESIVKEITFSSGYGTDITYISSENELYAAVSKPAIVYKYNWTEEEWEVAYSYNEDQYVDFIVKYNNKLLVSVGHDTDIASIYTYDYSASGLVASDLLPVSESRAYCFHELNNKLYIGSGQGGGDEYLEGAGSGGSVYLFDDGTVQGIDPNLSKIVENLDENVYSLTSFTGSANLLGSTGPDGYVYEIDVENQAAFIVYNATEPLVSINSLDRDTEKLVFVGGLTSGIIRKSLLSNNTYDVSFRTVSSKISTLKNFLVVPSGANAESYTSTYAAVGDTIYYLSDAGTWVWKYTHDEDINDITYDENNNTLYAISDTGITKINPLSQDKTVYLKLIDRAGNETVLDTTVAIDESKFMDSISISNLVDFTNENKIFELDELGNIIYTLEGDNKFYSADKIEEERGEYLSEIFDGTNDLVKWETISWQVVELFNTQVLMYVRTSASQNDILVADWVGPYYSYQSSGVDISNLSGQFIQFKAILTSTEKAVSPSFYSASIRAITSEALHFFTTNFTMPTRLNKGIITSRKVVPVSADIVFGINTTNSIDWTEYQPVDENRIFNINQTGQNLRVGIKLISPNRSLVEPTVFDEYGPYNSNLFVNTVDFAFLNNSGTTNNYHFRVSLYEDINLTRQVFSTYSSDSSDGFNVNGSRIPEAGVSIDHGESVDVLFTVPGSANIDCNAYYFVKIEYIYDTDFELFSDEYSFISSCTSSFIDNIDFNFTNNEGVANYYHFRIKFYQDLERTNEYTTIFSGNNRSGWFVDDVQIPEAGALVASGEIVNVVYRPDPEDFVVGTIYYLTIEAHDGDDYVFESNSYTFQIRDVQSTEYCGDYMDVPIVRNFGIMIELENNEFVTLNI